MPCQNIATEPVNDSRQIHKAIAQRDQLEFTDYISALVDLIISPETEPPLTIGIFASWGAGKSFILEHIKRRISEQANLVERPSNLLAHPRWQRPPRKVGRWVRSHWYRVKSRLWIVLQQLVGQLNQLRWTLMRLLFDEECPHPTLPTLEERKVEIKIVDYNAWEYSSTELIWPGLVRKIILLLENEVSIFTRLRVRVARNLKERAWLLRPSILIIIGAVAAITVAALWQGLSDELARSLRDAAGLAFLAALINLLYQLFNSPLSRWITQLFEKRDYGKSIGYMEEIRTDMETLERALKKRGKRVLVIIDDLDRCEPEKAVEMLQAIKLLLNFDSFVVIIGIDARIITQSVEKHYDGLLGPAGASGYEYLDKIIQIPFRIPVPTERAIKHFIEQQMGGNEPDMEIQDTLSITPPKTSVSSSPVPSHVPPLVQPALQNERETSVAEEHVFSEVPLTPETPRQAKGRGSTSPTSPQTIPTGESADEQVITVIREIGFTSEERSVLQALSTRLRPNPRHIKRVINVYRLVKILAQYRSETFILNNPLIVIHWVVLCAQWPYAMSLMLHYYSEALERISEDPQQKASLLPDRTNSLYYLYEKVKDQLNKKRYEILDYDPDLLRALLNEPLSAINWEELHIMRTYTVNFNPAVESTKAEQIEFGP